MKKIVVNLFLSLLSFVECTGFSVGDCGNTKACITNTPNCSITDSDCLFFSYVWNTTTRLFDMEMSGGSGNGQQWYGIAFSPNGEMMNSDLYVCTGTSFLSGVIRERSFPTILNELPSEVTSNLQETVNSIGRCSFTRPASVNKEITGGVQRDFNLLQTEFHLLQAFGTYAEATQFLQYHGTQNRWSSGPYDFSLFQPTQPPTTASSTTSSSTTTQVSQQQPRITDGCGQYKTCFFSPQNCNPHSEQCLFASWNSSETNEAFNFEISGGIPGNSNQYVGIAFGIRDIMQDADLYYCTASGITSAVIRERRSRPMTLSNTEPILRTTVEVNDGVIVCRFTRLRSVEKTLTGNAVTNFDLANEEYYLLLATGQLQNNQLQRHGTTNADRIISTTKINFSSASGLHLNINIMVLGFLLFLTNSWNCV